MKKNVIAIIILMSFVLCLKAQEIVNSGFEIKDIQSTTSAKYWKSNAEESATEVDSATILTGKYSMRILSEKKQAHSSFSQNIDFESDSFQKYRVSSWIKKDSIINAYLSVKIFNKNGNVEFYRMDEEPVLERNSWSNYSCEFYLDGTQKEIEVIGNISGEGIAWFDDFKLEMIKKEKESSLEAKNYISEALSIIEDNSIMIDSIDFPLIQETCLKNMHGLNSESDCYPLIWYVLNKLGDNHSFFLPPKEFDNFSSNNNLEQASGKIINDKFAYINVPAVMTADSIALTDFATKLQILIRELDSTFPKGWIVDLRNNLGGNCWPMLAGLGPLIGDGICGYLINSKDSLTISYRSGVSCLNERPITTINTEPYALHYNTPIAVLIGPNTASSGEITALSFVGKNNSKLFGEASYGVTTGNDFFKLSNNAFIVLTTTIDADRNRKKYGGKIQPDYPVNFSNESHDEDEDPVIIESIKWINNELK